jgi:hypothetical protein
VWQELDKFAAGTLGNLPEGFDGLVPLTVDDERFDAFQVRSRRAVQRIDMDGAGKLDLPGKDLGARRRVGESKKTGHDRDEHCWPDRMVHRANLPAESSAKCRHLSGSMR